VTAFIDVHDKLLFYAVAAWEDDFTGYVVDYGTFPDQKRAYFTARSATRTLGRVFRRAAKEGANAAGLNRLLDLLLGREWLREDGSLLHVGRCLIDAGYEADVVYSTIRRSAGAALIMPSLGQGITAANKPISEYSRKPLTRRPEQNWTAAMRPGHAVPPGVSRASGATGSATTGGFPAPGAGGCSARCTSTRITGRPSSTHGWQ